MTEYRNKYGLTARQERTNKAVAAIALSIGLLAAFGWVLWHVAT